MGLTAGQRTALQTEGLTNMDDFQDFQTEELKSAFKNCRSSTPPVSIPARASSRLLTASIAWHYYNDTGRVVTPVNMHFSNVLRDFHIEWKAILDLVDRDSELKLPVLTKSNAPIKWCESFKHYLHDTFGVRKVPLSYVIRSEVTVKPEADDPLEPNKAYGSSGSILQDLIDRSSHDHPLFATDNSSVYSLIEQAARTSQYLTTIKPFERRKDGRGAYLALVNAHVTDDKWDRLQKENMKWMMGAKWNGKKYALESFCAQHRSKYEQIVEAAQHIPFQIPDQRARVGYVLDNIDNSDAALQASIANIRTDQGPNGKRNNFESAVTTLLQFDPFLKSNAAKKSVSFNISGVDGNNGRGKKTNIDLRWHTSEEYKTLSREEKEELREWQQTKDGKAATSEQQKKYQNEKKRKRVSSSKKKAKAKIAALEKVLEEKNALLEEQKQEAEVLAVVKESVKTSGNNSDEKSLSMARNIMKIVARKTKSDN